MAPERTIPILPCRSIDDTLAFYEALGFAVTYRQERPNTFAAIVRGGIELQFFVLKGLEPGANYSTCYVLVDDVDALYGAFTNGIRAATGRVPSRGYPRIGPVRDMTYGVRQFIVVDPAGNHIRIGQPIEARAIPTTDEATRLARSLIAAITLADSRGDAEAAAAVLDSAFTADPPVAGATAYQALVLRADVALRLGDAAGARDYLRRARALEATAGSTGEVSDERRRAEELERELAADMGA